MTRITFTITTDQPVIVTALDGEPNSAISHDYIPGSVVRGMLIGRYMQQHKLDTLNLNDETTRRLFFSNATLFRNAYPLVTIKDTGSFATLPVPATWQREKDNPAVIYETARERPEAEKPAKSVRGFAAVHGTHALVVEVERLINVHTQRARKGGSDGTIFRYDAIAPRQQFQAGIFCEDTDADTLADLLRQNNTAHIGGARSAGYGRIRIDTISPAETVSPVPALNGNLILHLHSDVILRSASGQFLADEAALLETLQTAGIQFASASTLLSTTMTGGFNRTWGLPLPQAPALRMGGVVILEQAAVSAEAHTALREGIGERRNEGFGQMAIHRLDDLPAKYGYHPSEAASSGQSGDQELSDAEKHLWQQIRGRIQERRVQSEWVSIVYAPHYTITGNINRTQLARLRADIANELHRPSPGRAVLTKFLTDIAGKAAGQQFERARIGGRSLAAWLKEPRFEEIAESAQKRDSVMLQMVDAVLERAQKTREKEVQDA